MIQAANTAVRWDDHFKEKYDRIMNRRGKNRAKVAVARELVVAMYHMLINREPYRWSRQSLVTRKLYRLESMVRYTEKRFREDAQANVSFSDEIKGSMNVSHADTCPR